MTFSTDQRDMWQARALKAEAEGNASLHRAIKAEEALREIVARLDECPCTDATDPFIAEMQNIARAALLEKGE